VRRASAGDAADCLAIYRPYVEDTAVSWELDVPSTGEMAARITAACDTHDWLVLESGDRVVGFAYAHAFNRFPAYQWSAQTGLYIDADHHRSGGGRKLYTQLLARLTERGYRQVFAGIIEPSGSATPVCTAATSGNTTAGMTWRGCSSICLAPPNRISRPGQSSDGG